MNELLGNLSLSLSMLICMAAVGTSLVGGKLESRGMLIGARGLLLMVTALLSTASAALIAAFMQNDFRIEYVAHYSERALPVGYKLAAFWAGQEGSLLLWAWLMAVLASIAVIARRAEKPAEDAAFVATLSVLCGFFCALMLFAANPFKLIEVTPHDGRGLNPMLQDPNMIAHPPLLFLGYAGYAVPFAIMVGALIAGRNDNQWITDTRRWSIASWLFLSIGILLGAQWAYVELGWGGYWAWDPVENASLLPWLTGTAALHSIMVQQQRGMFKWWNASLYAATFVLCLFGTYLTRSGVIQSVHAFGESMIGTFFLGLIIVSVLFSTVLMMVRRKLLRSEGSLEAMLGREGLFLATNVLLCIMTAIVLIGTIFPILSRTFGSQEITVGPSFYNKVVAPLGLLLAGLMALGPMLSYGPDATRRLLVKGTVPFILALAAVAFAWVKGLRDPFSLGCTAIVVTALLSIVIELSRAAIVRAREHNENLLIALVQLLDSSHRRYGGQIVHIGVIMIVVGITGSSVFGVKETFSLKPGESAVVRDHKITYQSLKEVRHANFTAVQASVELTEPGGKVSTLHPQRRFYDKAEDANSEVAIQSNLRQDIYLMLAGWEGGGAVTAIQVYVNPLVSWIWIGGLVLTAGAIICLMPRLLWVRQTETANQPIRTNESRRVRARAATA